MATIVLQVRGRRLISAVLSGDVEQEVEMSWIRRRVSRPGRLTTWQPADRSNRFREQLHL
jgi:hypothetical protein